MWIGFARGKSEAGRKDREKKVKGGFDHQPITKQLQEGETGTPLCSKLTQQHAQNGCIHSLFSFLFSFFFSFPFPFPFLFLFSNLHQQHLLPSHTPSYFSFKQICPLPPDSLLLPTGCCARLPPLPLLEPSLSIRPQERSSRSLIPSSPVRTLARRSPTRRTLSRLVTTSSCPVSSMLT